MQVPSYQEVVERYDIASLRASGDLQLTTDGDIAVHDGDLKLGDGQYNAMFRLVQAWRYISPTLEGLFKLPRDSREAQQRLNDEREDVMSQLVASGWASSAVGEYHSTNDLIGANEIGETVCAGAFFVILNNLLMRFRYDTGAAEDKWSGCKPLTGGASFGAIVSAAANNFRHHDEWRRAVTPTPQQLASMKVLSPVLGLGMGIIRENICAKLLGVLGGGEYEPLCRMLFSFAKNITARGALVRCDGTDK
jgi:hypothetical protein